MPEEHHVADITIVHKIVIVRITTEWTITDMRRIMCQLEEICRQGYTTYIVDFTGHRNGFNITVISMLTHLTARLITCHGALLLSGFPEQDILSMLHLTGHLPLYDSLDKALDTVNLPSY